jgi:hypothetical protein
MAMIALFTGDSRVPFFQLTCGLPWHALIPAMTETSPSRSLHPHPSEECAVWQSMTRRASGSMLEPNAGRSERDGCRLACSARPPDVAAASQRLPFGDWVNWSPPASGNAGEGCALIRALLAEGLIEAAGRRRAESKPSGTDPFSATAAKRVKREAAQRALEQFLGRVEQVNDDPTSEARSRRWSFSGAC